MVLQEDFLFSSNIRENIRYGRLDATDEEVESAAKTVWAQRGGILSQGQRQLINFARAILADPRILVLDEATASVDTRTELVIQEALRKLLAERTSFVIAHRLSTIRDADQVLVMEEGRIVDAAHMMNLSPKAVPMHSSMPVSSGMWQLVQRMGLVQARMVI